MSTTPKSTQSPQELTFYDQAHNPLTLNVINSTLIQEENGNIYRILFEATPDLYQRIHSEALFNLKPELRGPLTGEEFLSDLNVQIEVILQPNLIAQVAQKAQSSDQWLTQLIELSRTHVQESTIESRNASQLLRDKSLTETKTEQTLNASESVNEVDESQSSYPSEDWSPLLFTESWFALQVKQFQPSGEVSYQTFWSHVKPSILAQATSSELSGAITSFFGDWANADMSVAEEVISEALDDVSSNLEDWVETSLLTVAENAITETFTEEYASEQTIPRQPSVNLKSSPENDIFKVVINFFLDDDWTFTKVQSQQMLRLAFQGKNGRLDCYAKVRQKQQQLVFYSIYPTLIDAKQRSSVSEFIARANYDLIIGNFEINFDNGEIRYKTSIDVQKDRLTPALIKNLVYTNVLTMDQYLPGILTILEKSSVTPIQAIQLIESVQSEKKKE